MRGESLRLLHRDDPPTGTARQVRFEEIYRADHDRIYGYVLRRLSDPHDAADVIAETFLTAWRRLDDVPPGEQARLWLYGVARRVLANHWRGQLRRSALADELRADLLTTAPPMTIDPAELSAIRQAFRRLPEADQELLGLVGWEGLDRAEIAQVLGCSRNAVRIRLYRARGKFARELAVAEAVIAPVRPMVAPGTRTIGDGL